MTSSNEKKKNGYAYATETKYSQAQQRFTENRKKSNHQTIAVHQYVHYRSTNTARGDVLRKLTIALAKYCVFFVYSLVRKPIGVVFSLST